MSEVPGADGRLADAGSRVLNRPLWAGAAPPGPVRTRAAPAARWAAGASAPACRGPAAGRTGYFLIWLRQSTNCLPDLRREPRLCS